MIAHPPFRMLHSYPSMLYTIKLMILKDSDEHVVHSWVLFILTMDILVWMISSSSGRDHAVLHQTQKSYTSDAKGTDKMIETLFRILQHNSTALQAASKITTQ